MKSSANHTFAQVPRAEIPRSSFNRTFNHKTTFDSGYLIPFFIEEALPGDTMSLRMTAFARLATPLHPFMDNLYMETQFFAVPVRLLWNNWEKFNGQQDNPGDSTDFVTPKMVAPVGGYQYASISDYFGLPTLVAGFSHVAFWHRAYNLIFNTWFRDQNLQTSRPVPLGDGPDNPSDYVLLRRGKRHDYFTSALPWPQKGPSVAIPLGTSAPVIGLGVVANTNTNMPTQTVWETGGGSPAYTAGWTQIADIRMKATGTNGRPAIYADLTAATAATINSLRQSFQVQKVFERDARGGTRYPEIILAHFGVYSDDARQQRPEFLGGGSSPVNISPVVQQSATTEDSPQGNLAAIGTTTLRGHGFTKSFTEHCVIIGLVSVRADLTYQQGLPRMFSRSTRFDFYWPELSHIGEQSVLMQEIFCTGTSADQTVFGYQERHAEYRYRPNQVTGKFRSNDPQSLDTWHLAQEFSVAPGLNATFIQEDPPVDRVIAVTDEPHFIADFHFNYHCARPMPVYSVPGLIDHF